MRKFSISVLSFLALAGVAFSDSSTPRMGLTKPTIGSPGWGIKTNNNWDIVDSSAAVLSKANVFTSTLTVNGFIKSTAGGFVFPDGSTQTVAGGGGSVAIGSSISGATPERGLFTDADGKLRDSYGFVVSTSALGFDFPYMIVGSTFPAGSVNAPFIAKPKLPAFSATFATYDLDIANNIGSVFNISGSGGVIGFNGSIGNGTFYTPFDGIGFSTNTGFTQGNFQVRGSGTPPKGTLEVNGSFATELRTITSTDTLTDVDHVVLADLTGGDFTATLPDAVDVKDRQYFIKMISTGTLTIDADGGLIDGFSTKVLTAQYEAYMFVSDGTNWWLF